MNEFVFINHFESSQIYEHFSQHGNTIATAKETYICVTCEKDRLVGCTIFIKNIGTTGI